MVRLPPLGPIGAPMPTWLLADHCQAVARQLCLTAMNPSPSALDLLATGTASLDVYYLSNGQAVHSPGGAGLYTALAAACSGARAGMFAPRPDPIPEPLRSVASRLEWIGPSVSPDQLPSFEIAHYGGGRAALLNASW